ncbi:MAG: sigma-70 family RNA polymerase sigma factor [bacterium]
MTGNDAEQTDEEIVKRVQMGEIDTFSFLVSRYEERMMRYARKFLLGYEEAQDSVQNVFIKAYRNINGFDIKRKFSSWLYRIAHNEFINVLKKKKEIPILGLDIGAIFPASDRYNAFKEVERKETKAMLEGHLNRLDPKYREVLVLFYFEDLDYKEISEVMHIPVSTVGVRLKRGKEIIKKVIKHEE